MAAMTLQFCGAAKWQSWSNGQRLGHATVAAKHVFATTQGDVFDVPIRPDIVHRVVRWQLAKRRQVRGAPSSFGSFNGYLSTEHNRSGRSKKQRTTKVARAEIRNPQPVASIVESVKWAFTTLPPTWESAAIATTVIFVAGAPVMLAGLSLSGYSNAFLLALLVWRAFGGRGTLIVSLYFILGTVATKVKIKQKEAAGIAEKKSGRRGPGSVWGSGAAGALCAVATISRLGGIQWIALWKLGFVASFCTKLSDTISSEIGKAYGKTTYLVTTLSIVPRGTEGAVSLEGTLAGLVASVILAVFAVYIKLIDQTGATICVFAAQVANLCESYVGAALQGRQGYEWITNDFANILNIAIGASLAILLKKLTG